MDLVRGVTNTFFLHKIYSPMKFVFGLWTQKKINTKTYETKQIWGYWTKQVPPIISTVENK